MTNTKMIELPDADDLDTGHYRDGDSRSMSLFLVPALERADDVPAVKCYDGDGSPMLAHHGRWACLGSYKGRVLGASALERLTMLTDELLALDATYEGTRWDGHNHLGLWSSDGHDAILALQWGWQEASDDLRSYWDADDWFGDTTWPELCAQASIDPERALGDDWEAVAGRVAEVIEPLQEAAVTGTEACVRGWAAAWREEYQQMLDDGLVEPATQVADGGAR